MGNRFEVNLKVGMFVSFGVLLLMAAIILLGGANSIFIRRAHYFIHFQNVDGLVVGSKVVLNGIRVGVIDDIRLDGTPDQIRVGLAIEKNFQLDIRKDTIAEVATQGILGDKYISLASSGKEQPVSQSDRHDSTRCGHGELLPGMIFKRIPPDGIAEGKIKISIIHFKGMGLFPIC